MGSLQGPVICPAVRAKQAGASMLTIDGPLSKTKFMNSGFWGSQKIKGAKKNEGYQLNVGKWKKVQCGYSSSSNGNNSKAENFNEKDEDYVNSSVIEAVEVKNGPEGFLVKMRDGNHLRCTHNHPQAGRLPDYAPHPAIVLKMEDGSGIILPIIVLEMPSALLMAALRNVQIVRPTMYQVVQEMIDKMGYAVKLVRVTKRVHEAYFAQLYLTKVGNEAESVSFDLRPSDAINIAVRCKVPIQVNRHLAYNDGMKVMELGKPTPSSVSEGLLFTELDRPSGKPCIESKEFDIVQNMWMAAGEERYKDAADWKDKLSEFRSNKKWT